MSFTTYGTAIAGSVLTAAFWNAQVRDNGIVLKTNVEDDGSLSPGVFLERPELQNYIEVATAASIVAGVLTLDLALGCEFTVSLNANITSLVISNVPGSSGDVTTLTIRFTADGTPRTIAWGAAFKWAGGTAPTPTSTTGKIDIVTARTYDDGTSWLPAVFTQNA